MENEKDALAVIMSAEQFEKINSRLNLVEQHLQQMSGFNFKRIINNEEFIKHMGVSKTTAHVWRDKGLIAYSQIGHVIYYTLDDIDEFVKNHRVVAFQQIDNYKIYSKSMLHENQNSIQ